MGDLARYLRILAIVMALGLSSVLVFGSNFGVEGDVPYWLLILPVFLLMVASWLASRARGGNISSDGSTENKSGHDR